MSKFLFVSVLITTTVATAGLPLLGNSSADAKVDRFVGRNFDIKVAQSLDCQQLEQFGRAFQPQLLAAINSNVAGTSYEINRRKDLEIHQVEGISFDGCRVTTQVRVTLERKIRRDAHGVVTLRGDVASFSPATRQVCYRNAKVINVNLSRTLRIGEGFYKWVANKVLPDGGCLGLS